MVCDLHEFTFKPLYAQGLNEKDEYHHKVFVKLRKNLRIFSFLSNFECSDSYKKTQKKLISMPLMLFIVTCLFKNKCQLSRYLQKKATYFFATQRNERPLF